MSDVGSPPDLDPAHLLGAVDALAHQAGELHRHLQAHLRRCAPLTWQRAGQSCQRGTTLQPGCFHYHRAWQYLRILGVNPSIDADSRFLLALLNHLGQQERSGGTLLCGAADFSLLAHLLWSGNGSTDAPDITVMDRCPTALWANQWYAAQQGINLTLMESDILSLDPAGCGRFDLIASHNLLLFYPPLERTRILQQWFALLRPGGHLLTVVTLRPGSTVAPDEPRAASRSQVDKAAELVARALAEQVVDLPAADLIRAARDFAASSSSYHIASGIDFLNTVTDHGFVLRVVQVGREPNPLRDSPRQARERLRRLARKP